MKNSVAALFGLILIAPGVYGQSCEDARAENQRLKEELASLKGNIATTSTNSFVAQAHTDRNISFKVTSVTGNKQYQTVAVTIMVTNKGTDIINYNTRVTSFINAEGDEFRFKSALLGMNTNSPETTFADLYTNTPLKTVYIFEGVFSEASIKMLPFAYFNGDQEGRVEFRDLPIAWR